MKKSPIKVIVRLRPTSNFAHQQMTVDEQTGYPHLHSDKSRFTLSGPSSPASSIISKTSGGSNMKKSCRMPHRKSSIISAPRRSSPQHSKGTLDASYAMGKREQVKLSR